MIINDRIYGDIKIENPLIADLILSKPMQRLNDISQDGAVHFIQTDKFVLAKLKTANDSKINHYLNRLNPETKFIYTSKEEAEFYGPNKARFVDPLVLHAGALKRVSELIPGVKEYFEELKQMSKYIGVKQKNV